jgi:hypothetical protein
MLTLRRGFFRLWILISGIWLILITLFSWQQISAPHLPSRYFLLSHNAQVEIQPVWEPISSGGRQKVEFPNSITLLVDPSFTQRPLPPWILYQIGEKVKARDREVADERLAMIVGLFWVFTIPVISLLFIALSVAWAFKGFYRGN